MITKLWDAEEHWKYCHSNWYIGMGALKNATNETNELNVLTHNPRNPFDLIEKQCQNCGVWLVFPSAYKPLTLLTCVDCSKDGANHYRYEGAAVYMDDKERLEQIRRKEALFSKAGYKSDTVLFLLEQLDKQEVENALMLSALERMSDEDHDDPHWYMEFAAGTLAKVKGGDSD